jgi:hypothetical protein
VVGKSKILTSHILAVRPNLREWWVGDYFAAIMMYCSGSIANNTSWQQFKEE